MPDLYLFRWSTSSSTVATDHNRVLGGYQGTVLSYQYFGTWDGHRRDRRRRHLAPRPPSLAVRCHRLDLRRSSLSGTSPNIWLPWQALENLPILENVVPYRFILITYLAVAVMLGLIVEHIYVAVNRRRHAARAAAARRTSPGPGGRDGPGPAQPRLWP